MGNTNISCYNFQYFQILNSDREREREREGGREEGDGCEVWGVVGVSCLSNSELRGPHHTSPPPHLTSLQTADQHTNDSQTRLRSPHPDSEQSANNNGRFVLFSLNFDRRSWSWTNYWSDMRLGVRWWWLVWSNEVITNYQITTSVITIISIINKVDPPPVRGCMILTTSLPLSATIKRH